MTMTTLPDDPAEPAFDYTATYSPDDNTLRLRGPGRLDDDTHRRVAAAGFKRAPRQDLWFAPAWTPQREDLLLELCGEIADEDTSLVARAEDRAERFSGYGDRRAAEAETARAAVAAIADGIPLGQPILVGHHSEARARRDAERILAGMRRAVDLWATSTYWTERARGAIRHARYKERPDVRARRIKGLETDRRKQERQRKDAETFLRLWSNERLTDQQAKAIANHFHAHYEFPLDRYPRQPPASQYEGSMSLWSALNDGIVTTAQARELATGSCSRIIADATRWITHLDNRLAYERAMLDEQGGTVADRTRPEKGGACRCWASPRGGWSYIQRVNKVSVTVLDNWGNGGGNFSRTAPFDKLSAVMTAAEVAAARDEGRMTESHDGIGFYLHDARSVDPQPPAAERRSEPTAPPGGSSVTPDPAPFERMRETLSAGVRVVVAHQLVPTTRQVARQVIELADIQPGHRILEPSAGTGALLDAAIRAGLGFDCGVRVVAVEVNRELADALLEMRARWLYANDANFEVRCADFLSCRDLGTFHRIVMNPPFENGDDIRHIEHARRMLKPGGRLVSVCANGPRQRERLLPVADTWVDLPPGSFQQSGTMVNVAILMLRSAA